MTAGDAPLPVVLVAGIHAEARAKTVAHLLRVVPGSVVLHHDLRDAPSGAVVRELRDASGTLATGETPLVNDCACCALREDLVPELRRLARDGSTRLALVELWDSVEPRAMAEVVVAHAGEPLRLGNVLTAVDPALVLACLGNGDELAEAGLAAAPTDERTVGDTFARQLEYPGVLVLAGQDGENAPDDLALLAQPHPTARRSPLGSPELPGLLRAGFDTEAAAAAQHPAMALLPQEAQEAGIGTLVWRHRRPFHPGRLFEALEELCCAAVRSRGRFWLADRPDTLLHWDAAGGALCVETAGPWLRGLPDAAWELVPPLRRAAAALDWDPEHGDREQYLVFTSPDLDREGIAGLLASCVLTDAEMAGGTEAWKEFPASFDQFLDPVH
ncbi:cobalamin synthesis CobW domain-containing protein [Streptomyces sp. SPB78]|uniref:CobW family GTP-binding protein n=1 Tax=Streptomyces sp. (strain SPB78) TaxID=591157 RepID=UPI0001B57F65|nr:GTP-binding protein [Streptomyces sp. SPB78]EFL04067.1 cobalamin synthesis CobW domain-containing protein [Streptomyces sp. SPB78]